MFKGFKPQGLQKIASRMGYAGRMEEFDNYLEQNPEKQREMITYQAKAQEMANGGLLKFQPQNPGGETSKQAKFAPMYNQFKESDFYKDSQKGVGATVTGGAIVDITGLSMATSLGDPFSTPWANVVTGATNTWTEVNAA